MKTYIIIYIVDDIKFEVDKMVRMFQKLTLYISTIILCFLFDRFILENELFGIEMFLSKFMTCVWVYQESKSIDKNWIKTGNASILSSIKDFISGLKCIKNNYDNLKKDKDEN
jgi:penicillin-binding protein-related factor A (putative recombinase)